MRNKIQAPDKQVLHKQVPKAQALQKEKDPRLVAVGGFGQVVIHISIIADYALNVNSQRSHRGHYTGRLWRFYGLLQILPQPSSVVGMANWL